MLATQKPPNPPNTHHHHHQYPLPPDRETPKSPWPQATTPTPAPASFPCLDAYVRAQNEALESRLESLRRKYEALDETFKRTETEKARLREQLVARETELYEAKRSLERNFPPLSERVRAVEDASRAHLATAQVIESKISAVHDILDELRHAGGEGTEAEDSPEKRDRYVPVIACVSACLLDVEGADCSPEIMRVARALPPQVERPYNEPQPAPDDLQGVRTPFSQDRYGLHIADSAYVTRVAW